MPISQISTQESTGFQTIKSSESTPNISKTELAEDEKLVMDYLNLEEGDFSIKESGEYQNGEKIKLVVFLHNQELPADLPKGYFFMGGVARNVLLQSMGEEVEEPRDLDIVAIQGFNPDLSKADELSKRYMPGDYEHGHGVKTEETEEYFRTRDFTLNEILVNNKGVLVSLNAIEDIRDKVIRPTEYEQESWKSYEFGKKGVHPKLVMKSLRMFLEFQELYKEGSIEGIEEWQWDFTAVPPFFIALQLNKAYERGDALATKFYLELLSRGVLSGLDSDVKKGERTSDLAKALRREMGGIGWSPFNFNKESLNTEDLDLSDEELYEKYAEMANTYGRIKGSESRDEY